MLQNNQEYRKNEDQRKDFSFRNAINAHNIGFGGNSRTRAFLNKEWNLKIKMRICSDENGNAGYKKEYDTVVWYTGKTSCLSAF